jgi:hypothetical protein
VTQPGGEDEIVEGATLIVEETTVHAAKIVCRRPVPVSLYSLRVILNCRGMPAEALIEDGTEEMDVMQRGIQKQGCFIVVESSRVIAAVIEGTSPVAECLGIVRHVAMASVKASTAGSFLPSERNRAPCSNQLVPFRMSVLPIGN